MSVTKFLEIQAAPLAFVLVLNSIWDRFEGLSIVAIFDTEEQARKYETASRLPKGETTEDGDRRMYRAYREDSLLRDFNAPTSTRHGVFSAPNDYDYSATPINPDPPIG